MARRSHVLQGGPKGRHVTTHLPGYTRGPEDPQVWNDRPTSPSYLFHRTVVSFIFRPNLRTDLTLPYKPPPPPVHHRPRRPTFFDIFTVSASRPPCEAVSQRLPSRARSIKARQKRRSTALPASNRVYDPSPHWPHRDLSVSTPQLRHKP